VVDLIQQGIDSTSSDLPHVQVGFRIDSKKRVPYARSDLNVFELIERVCDDRKALVDSVRLTGRGDSEPEDHVVSLCKEIVEDFADELLVAFVNDVPGIRNVLCRQQIAKCPESTESEHDSIKQEL
jgi:hypothetical protein